MRWSYKGDWAHLSKLGFLAPVFRALPEWARPCPMSVDFMRAFASIGGLSRAASSDF